MEYFDGKEDDDESVVRNKSDFTPPKNRNNALEKFISNLENTPISTRNIKCKENVSQQQREAIKRLSEDRSIVIKEADKGGSVVIMDTEHYKTMAYSILNQNEYYEHLEKDPHRINMSAYTKLVDKYKDILTEKEKNYLLQFESKESNFYGLPKVHKSAQIASKCKEHSTPNIEISNVTDLKLRPIIAGPECLTHRLSNLIDILLRPFTKQVKSYLRDSMDFLNHLPERVPEETTLASFDVESLYSNIAHNLGLKAIKFWLQKHPEDLHTRFTDNFILDSIEFILKNNTFYFNGEHYRQRKGTAMGTKFAPVYATLTIGFLEETLYQKVSNDFGNQFGEYFMKFWNRFLDDCFVPWTRSVTDLHRLHQILNSLHPDIKFTIEYSQIELPFLDVLVKKTGSKIDTDIYYKPTDSQQYLIFNSCHPKHIKLSIPYSLARRLRMIISNDEIVLQRMSDLKQALLKQKYPESVIDAGFQRALNLNKSELRRVRQNPEENVVTYVSTFNPKNPELFGTIRQNLNILYEDQKMNTILQTNDIIKSKRQPQNLKRLLTRAKFDENIQTATINRCNRPNCGLCKYIIVGSNFSFKCGKTFNVTTNMGCEVKNLIYVMQCNGCGEEYIGETGDSLRHRMTVHRQQIRNSSVRILHVSNHMAACARNCENPFRLFPLYKMKQADATMRKMKETYFIDMFKPKLNRML